MKSIILAVIFAVHALVFARAYLNRGRNPFSICLVLGFSMLLAYYGYESWQSFGSTENVPSQMAYVRWTGIALCVVALPWLLSRLFRSVRTKVSHRVTSLDSEDADY